MQPSREELEETLLAIWRQNVWRCFDDPATRNNWMQHYRYHVIPEYADEELQEEITAYQERRHHYAT